MQVTIIPLGVIGTNCYFLQADSGSCAVIDPGAQPDKIIQNLEERKLRPVYILLTHGHYDHIGGVKGLMKQYPEARLYIGKEDVEMLADTQKSLAILRNTQAENYLISDALPAMEGDELQLDELTIRVVETPGHTKGGVVYLCRDVMFSGDTLFAGDVGRTDLYGGNYEVLKGSLKKLAELEGDYCVYPGHGDSSTLEYERNNNRYVKECGSST